MSVDITQLIEQLSGGLVVSCQALRGDPLDRPDMLAAIGRSAELGGAVALRGGVREIRLCPDLGQEDAEV